MVSPILLKYDFSSVFTAVGPEYILGEKNVKTCTTGSMILDKSECKRACEQLGLKMGNLFDGNHCYMKRNGKCRQSKKMGKKDSLICKASG